MILAAPMNTYVQYVFATRFLFLALAFALALDSALTVILSFIFSVFIARLKFVATNLYRSHRAQT